ncbi:MAG: D-inositol 3-phosphate glycosyltransferase [Firmicutes bacterium ADurb.Bin456]|nr:MAG: D-inositol 3-phosphate glycosyltransferase [Firmicutes bacterium ADurb.Bin456]
MQVFYPRYPLLPQNWLFAYSGWFYYQATKNLVKKLSGAWPFELIHAHTALPDGYAGLLFSRIFKKPLVVTIHGRDLQDTVFRNGMCRRAVLEVLRGAGAVVNVSGKLADLCKFHLGENAKIKVIGNGIDPAAIYRDYSPLRKKYAGSKIILSVGSLKKTKGHDLTLRAFRIIKEHFGQVTLLVIGGGEERENLLSLAGELGIGKAVEFIAPLPHSKVMEYMSASDLFVLPSWLEGFGIVYLEAMAHGKPVIGVRGQGISDVIHHGINGLLVEPFDEHGLADAVLGLLKNQDYALSLGERARATVLKDYTWTGSAQKLLDLYQSLTTGGDTDV